MQIYSSLSSKTFLKMPWCFCLALAKLGGERREGDGEKERALEIEREREINSLYISISNMCSLFACSSKLVQLGWCRGPGDLGKEGGVYRGTGCWLASLKRMASWAVEADRLARPPGQWHIRTRWAQTKRHLFHRVPPPKTWTHRKDRPPFSRVGGSPR